MLTLLLISFPVLSLAVIGSAILYSTRPVRSGSTADTRRTGEPTGALSRT